MKKLLFYTIALLVCNFSYAQVGIGTTSPQSRLDVRSSNSATPLNTDGLLIPKVDQFATTNPTVQQHGMLVQLTTTVGSNAPGFYYWNHPTTTWLPLATSNVGWDLIGNSGTNPTSNFLGTTDAQSLVIRTNNTERLRVLTNGNVGIGITNPTARIEANVNPTNDFATIKANGNFNATGYLGSQGETNFDGIATADWNGLEIGVIGISNGTTATDNIGVLGHSNTVGMRAEHTNGTNWAELGTTNYGGLFNGRVEMQSTTDANGNPGTGVLEIGNSLRIDGNEIITNTNSTLYINSDNNGDVAMDGDTFRMDASANRIGIGDISPDSKLDVYTNVNYEYGLIAHSVNGHGASIRGGNVDHLGGWWFCGLHATNACGTGNTNFTGHPGLSVGGQGIGVLGVAQHDTDANTDHTGGLFVTRNISTSGVRAISAVAADINNTIFKIIGSGTVSTIVQDTEGKQRIMHATETPEALFQDYGEGQLAYGKATITLDPILSHNIVVDPDHPLRVFIQLKGDCKGTYVTKQTTTGFEVIELQGGTSNAKFSWSVTANRKDEILGGQISKYQDLRFETIKDPKFNYKDLLLEEEDSNHNLNEELNTNEKQKIKSELTPNTNESKQ